MTVTALTTNPEHFSCNGSLVAFDFSLGVSVSTEIEVIHSTAAGVETTLVPITDYVVSTTNDDYSSGGTVTTTETYASGITLTIRMVIALTQATDFVENMPTLYEEFEESLDKLTRIGQQLNELLERCLSFSRSSGETGEDVVPSPSSLKFLRWNVGATGLENADLTTNLADLSAHEADGQLHKKSVQAVTIGASGVLALASYTAKNFFVVSAETGTEDTLSQITGLTARDSISLAAAAGDTITVEKNTNLRLQQTNFVLDNIYSRIDLEALGGDIMTEHSRAYNT